MATISEFPLTTKYWIFITIAECGKLGEISMWFPTGCYHQIQKWFEERLHFVGIAGFVVAFLQVEFNV